jgi:hypothetical protein
MVAHRSYRLPLGQTMQAEPPETACHHSDGQSRLVGYLPIPLAGTTLLDETGDQGI